MCQSTHTEGSATLYVTKLGPLEVFIQTYPENSKPRNHLYLLIKRDRSQVWRQSVISFGTSEIANDDWIKGRDILDFYRRYYCEFLTGLVTLIAFKGHVL